MRRILSILLVLFFSLGPLAATMRAAEDASLPACCRTHGAHHCEMSDAAVERATGGNLGSTHFFAAPSHCPLYPAGTLAPSSSSHALATIVADVHARASSKFRATRNPFSPSSPLSLGLPVRGPPSLA
ncbi:MAG TPA: hypothetical protein VHZ28_18140 [Terracidiphilus sp.]|nr:hypothetical protein [Terracidiphilus sp.]